MIWKTQEDDPKNDAPPITKPPVSKPEATKITNKSIAKAEPKPIEVPASRPKAVLGKKPQPAPVVAAAP